MFRPPTHGDQKNSATYPRMPLPPSSPPPPPSGGARPGPRRQHCLPLSCFFNGADRRRRDPSGQRPARDRGASAPGWPQCSKPRARRSGAACQPFSAAAGCRSSGQPSRPACRADRDPRAISDDPSHLAHSFTRGAAHLARSSRRGHHVWRVAASRCSCIAPRLQRVERQQRSACARRRSAHNGQEIGLIKVCGCRMFKIRGS